MTNTSPFDHGPDRELGAALREVLSAEDHAGFVARVVAAAGDVGMSRRANGDWWEVLRAWARPGLAAALLLLMAGAALWFSGRADGPRLADVADPLRAADEQLAVPTLLASPQAPDVDVILAAAMGN